MTTINTSIRRRQIFERVFSVLLFTAAFVNVAGGTLAMCLTNTPLVG